MNKTSLAALAVLIASGCTAPVADSEAEEVDVHESALDSSLSGLAAWAQRTDSAPWTVGSDAAGNTMFIGGPLRPDYSFDRKLIKLDPYGRETLRRDLPDAWAASGFGRDGSVALSVSSDNGEVDYGCGLARAPMVVKLGPDGTCQWQRTIATGAWGGLVRVAEDGGVVVSGVAAGTIDFGNGPITTDDQIVVARYDASGNLMWTRMYGEARAGRRRGQQAVLDMELDAAGNLYMGGFHYGALDFGGGTMMGGTPPGHAFVGVLSPSGSYVRQASYGTRAEAAALAVTRDGRVAIAGLFLETIDFGNGKTVTNSSGSADAYVAVFEANGTARWVKKFGAPASRTSGTSSSTPTATSPSPGTSRCSTARPRGRCTSAPPISPFMRSSPSPRASRR